MSSLCDGPPGGFWHEVSSCSSCAIQGCYAESSIGSYSSVFVTASGCSVTSQTEAQALDYLDGIGEAWFLAHIALGEPTAIYTGCTFTYGPCVLCDSCLSPCLCSVDLNQVTWTYECRGVGCC